MTGAGDISSRLPFYVLPCATGTIAALLGQLADLPAAGRYVLAFALLTATLVALLTPLLLAARRTGDSGVAAERPPTGGNAGEGFVVTRFQLGLEHLYARSGEATGAPTLELPSDDPSRSVWLRVDGPDLVVGARAREPAPQFARVEFASLGPIYLLLLAGEEPGAVCGRATVGGVAVDLTDQPVSTDWLGLADLPAKDAKAIAFSVASANHATRRAWRETVRSLPAEHPVRVAVEHG